MLLLSIILCFVQLYNCALAHYARYSGRTWGRGLSGKYQTEIK